MMLFWTEKGTVHYEWRGLRPEAEHHAPALCPQSAGATAHARTQEGAVGTDPSMSDISYIDVKTRKTSPHMHAHSGSRRDPHSPGVGYSGPPTPLNKGSIHSRECSVLRKLKGLFQEG